MKLLLDTHIFLWLQSDPRRLNDHTLAMVTDPTTELLLSAASAWEIAIKSALGRLHLPEPPEVYVPTRMEISAVDGLAIDSNHALAVASLPLHHRDPFDRILIAQAQHESIALVTADINLMAYDLEVIDARQTSRAAG